MTSISASEYRDITHKTKKGRYPVTEKARRTAEGITFDSMREMCYYVELKCRVSFGEIRDLELQPRFEIVLRGQHVCTYTADFRYRLVLTGEFVVVDVKSKNGTSKNPYYRLRKKLTEIEYGIKIVEVY